MIQDKLMAVCNTPFIIALIPQVIRGCTSYAIVDWRTCALTSVSLGIVGYLSLDSWLLVGRRGNDDDRNTVGHTVRAVNVVWSW